MTPRGILIHTAGVAGDPSAAAMRKYHVEHNGWRDIGYHRVVRKSGLVEVGRPLWQAGAHAEGANNTLGICVSGDGDREPWTTEQTASTIDLCVAWCLHFKWGVDVVGGHREAQRMFGGAPTTKTCPGLLVDMDQIRALVALGLFARAPQ